MKYANCNQTYRCVICGGWSCSKLFTRTRLFHILRALWLAVRIVEWPWQDNAEWAMGPTLAWEIAASIWLAA